MLPSFFRLVSPPAVLLIAAANLSAADPFNPENGHYYRVMTRPLSWDNARVVAFSQTHDGVRGHLATITSAAEQAFIESIAPNQAHVWLGGFQPPGSSEPDGNWQWVTGEPFSYSHWRLFDGQPEEPNDRRATPEDLLGEDRIEMRAVNYDNGIPVRYWNDISAFDLSQPNYRPFVVEFTPGFTPTLNASDFLNWQRDVGSQSAYGRADFNGDGVVNEADLELWKANSVVPEPPTATTLIATAGGLVNLLRRRRGDSGS
jgi:hypothetical protein